MKGRPRQQGAVAGSRPDYHRDPPPAFRRGRWRVTVVGERGGYRCNVEKIPFDPTNPSVEAARRIVLTRLRHDPQWHTLDNSGEGFDSYVEYEGTANRGVLNLYAREVFWQFVVEGILAPGWNSSNLELPGSESPATGGA